MGGISSDPVRAWKEKINWFMNSRQYRKFDRIDGESITTLQILAEIRLRWNVNLSNSMDLSSCQSITTLYVEKKETKKLMLRSLFRLQIVLENSRKDIGRFKGLDQKRSGTELTYTNQMENRTMSLILWWLISVRADIPFFVDPVLLM